MYGGAGVADNLDFGLAIFWARSCRRKMMAMTQGHRQPKWNIYEAVILLDGYIEIFQDNKPRSKIIKCISADLRQMAINRGMTIDGTYRDKNGISYQMQSMDSAYKGETVYIPATRLFVETVELYRTDTRRYFDILKEAKNLIVAKQNNRPLLSLPPKDVSGLKKTFLR